MELNDATKSLNTAWEEVSSVQEKNKILQQQLDSTAEENVKLKEDFEALRVRIVKQEDYSRRENLRFYNIPESAQETNDDCIQKVKQVLSDLGAPSDIKFHAIHRTGKPNNYGASSKSEGEPRPRPMMARFLSRIDSEAIWFMSKEVLKSPRFSTVLIDKDLSPESARERANFRAAYKKAKDLNIAEKVFIKGKNLIINSSKYSVNTLPEYLLPHQDGNSKS